MVADSLQRLGGTWWWCGEWLLGFVVVRLTTVKGKGGDNDRIYMIGLGFYANWAWAFFCFN